MPSFVEVRDFVHRAGTGVAVGLALILYMAALAAWIDGAVNEAGSGPSFRGATVGASVVAAFVASVPMLAWLSVPRTYRASGHRLMAAACLCLGLSLALGILAAWVAGPI